MATKAEGQERKTLVPYISYRTLRSFLESLKISIPARIDRSVMPTQSGGGQTQLLAALRALDLIEADGTPTVKLEPLVHAYGKGDKEPLRDLLQGSYPWLFQGFALEKASPHQLRERFEQQDMSGDTVRKAVAFFLAAAKDAGIPVSPHIKSAPASRPGKSRGRRLASAPVTNGDDPGDEPEGRSARNWTEALLDKFPKFDPSWPADVQAKWFESFKQLMDMKPESSEEQE